LIPDEMKQIPEPMVQMVPAPGFEDVPEMIVESENNCDSSYPDVCIPPWPPDLNCGDVRYVNFRVLPDVWQKVFSEKTIVEKKEHVEIVKAISQSLDKVVKSSIEEIKNRLKLDSNISSQNNN